MNDLAFYFKEGWHHIISLNALDHQLFIVALSAIYILKDLKKVLILVTAFTVGHSITLALSIYDVIRANENWIEFLIPITIIITATFNFFVKEFDTKNLQLNYFFALFFGFIHGLGFANSIRFMLARNQKIGTGLLGFNLGLEAGQIVCVALILLSAYLVINIAGLKRTWWMYTLSTITILWAVKFAIERVP